jgi:geranylgeranyl reductase family protein
MRTYNCDILVVGAGPAGSAAALIPAEKGLRVLMVDRRRVVGVPVQCAEYIPAPLLGEIDLGRRFLVQSILGMKTILPGNGIRETNAPGFTIHRDIFDQTMADAAVKAGADIRLSTRVTALDDKKDVILEGLNGETSKVRAKVIIGADGPRSTVGRWVGSVNRNRILGIQARLALTGPMEFTEVYFDRDIFAGYGWLFPKGLYANVGLGMNVAGGTRTSIRRELNKFIVKLISEGKIKGEPQGCTAGWIPAEPVRPAVYGNILLAGDAAGHTHPITGAGIFSAVTCGRLAGKWAARAVQQDNPDLLKEYDAEWRDFFGESLGRAYQRRRQMENQWDRFDQVIKQCWVAFREYYATSETAAE